MKYRSIAGEVLQYTGNTTQEKLDNALVAEFRAWAELVPNMETVKHNVAAVYSTSIKRVEDAIRRYVDTQLPA